MTLPTVGCLVQELRLGGCASLGREAAHYRALNSIAQRHCLEVLDLRGTHMAMDPNNLCPLLAMLDSLLELRLSPHR